MNITVIDYTHLAADADFPPLDADKFGWEQYPQLAGDELPDRCWRSNVIVTIATPIGRAPMKQLAKLAMIVIAGANQELVDLEAARECNIAVSFVPDTQAENPADVNTICSEVVANINAFIRGDERNRIL